MVRLELSLRFSTETENFRSKENSMTTNAEKVVEVVAEFTELVKAALQNDQDVSVEIKAGGYDVYRDKLRYRKQDGSAVLLVVIGPRPPSNHT